jgi:hypothetical protein
MVVETRGTQVQLPLRCETAGPTRLGMTAPLSRECCFARRVVSKNVNGETKRYKARREERKTRRDASITWPRYRRRVTSWTRLPPPPVSISSCSPAHTLDQILDFSLHLTLLAYLSENTSPYHRSCILSISILNNPSQDVNDGLQRRFRRRDGGQGVRRDRVRPQARQPGPGCGKRFRERALAFRVLVVALQVYVCRMKRCTDGRRSVWLGEECHEYTADCRSPVDLPYNG